MSDDVWTPELWLVALCAWNNVEPNNEAMKRYVDEKWSVVSQEGWKRVAAALSVELEKRKS